MSIITFTVEEINIIAIYRADTLGATLTRIAEASPYMDEDILTIAESAAWKLTALTERDFTELSFVPADEYEGDV